MQAKLLTLLMATMVVCSTMIAQNLPNHVPQDDLLGWFPMDGNADDLSPLEHHGLTSGPIAWGADRFGNPTAALDLSAEGGDYVDLPASLDSSFTNAMTVACWVNYPAESGQTIFRSGPTPGLFDNFQALIWNHVGLQQMTLRLYTESGYYTSYPYPEEEQWKHLTMMVQEDLVKLFVNGQLVHEHSGNPFINSPGIFRIGESMFANPYDYRGSIDDFGVWNRALSAAEVELLYSETPIVQGCTDDAACNYSPGANLNDGSCTYPLIAGDCNAGAVACSEGMYWNPLVQQCMPTTCPTCPADVDQDNVIGVSDLLQMLSLFGGVCPEGGCTDPQAMNYDPLVGFNDGSCIYPPCLDAFDPFGPCDDGNSNTFNDALDADGCLCEGDDYVAEDGSGPCEGVSTLNFFGHEYQLVELGSQCWFAENSRNHNFTNGDTIPNGLSNAEWVEIGGPATGVYGQSLEGCGDAFTPGYNACDPDFAIENFGRLYNFYAVEDGRGLCPIGWSVASDSAWQELESWLGMPEDELNLTGWRGSNQGHLLKSSELWYAGFNGADSVGFHGTPTGYRHYEYGAYVDAGYNANYWTSSVWSWNKGTLRMLYGNISGNSVDGINRGAHFKPLGRAVRCVKLAEGACYDPDGDGVCSEDEISGCTDTTACNYDASATHDDGSCVDAQEPGLVCDDGDSNTFNDVWDETGCECAGVPAVAQDGSGPCEGVESVNYYEEAYDLIEIGQQCWFRENLKTLRYQNGDSIQLVLGDEEWSAAEDAAVTYRPDSLQTLIHGYYYNWWAVTSETGICPTGWRSPSHQDWSDLEFALGMDSIQAYSLGYSRGMPENIASIMLTAGSNASGFSATGNGYRSDSGAWGNTYTVFWTSDDASNNSGAITRKLLGTDNGVTAVLDPKKWGAAVRCIKEDTE